MLPLWVYQHLPLMVFVFMFGACVGSFINVVIHRLPAGMGIILPPSRCPTCGARLRFFQENLPILGWFILRGRCRFCNVRISAQYMIVELAMAIAFLGLYIVLYMVPPETAFLGAIGGEWWYQSHQSAFFRTWPIFVAITFLFAGLYAMTMIDARTFTIPMQIPLFITASGFAAYLIQGFLPLHPRYPDFWPIPGVDWQWFLVAVGGMVGVVIGVIMLKTGKMPYSFADYHEYVEADQVIGEYPHARREMFAELLFLTPCLLGVLGGWFLGALAPAEAPPVWAQSIGGSFLGYLVGGGIVWGVRILGTFAFGREAMGLGDVHLLAAVGAVLGPLDPVWIFFLAPFFGIGWVLLATGLGSVFKGFGRELPYGPHLAAATVAVFICREWIDQIQQTYAPFIALPGLA